MKYYDAHMEVNMLQFKSVAIPATEIKVKGDDMYTVETANRVIAPVAMHIQQEAKGGWHLHSYVICPATVKRRKGIFEFLFGWIPVIGLFFRSNKPDVIYPNYYMLIFQREV